MCLVLWPLTLFIESARWRIHFTVATPAMGGWVGGFAVAGSKGVLFSVAVGWHDKATAAIHQAASVLVIVPVKQDPQINVGYFEGSSFGYLHHEVDQWSDISEGRIFSIFRVTGSGSGEAEVVMNKRICLLHQKEKIWPIRVVEGEDA